MKKRTNTAAILLAALISSPLYAAAPVSDATSNSASNAELLSRIDELTRMMTIRNKMQVRFQSQLDELGQELREMRGSLEVFENQLNQVEDRQRTLYQMLDERQSTPAAQSPLLTTTPATGSATNDEAAYRAAVDLVLTDKQYSQAITAFEAFVIDHPTSTYVPNAQYWLGQLLYRDKKRSEARAAFLIVTDKYPKSNKRADSLFKIGIIDEYSGDIESAKSFYQKTIEEYPSSSAAGLASKRLEAL